MFDTITRPGDRSMLLDRLPWAATAYPEAVTELLAQGLQSSDRAIVLRAVTGLGRVGPPARRYLPDLQFLAGDRQLGSAAREAILRIEGTSRGGRQRNSVLALWVGLASVSSGRYVRDLFHGPRANGMRHQRSSRMP